MKGNLFMRQRHSFSVIVALMIVLSLLLASCTVAPVATTDVEGDVTYTLGIAQPLTGSLGEFGTDFARGIELAVEQMNAELSAAGVLPALYVDKIAEAPKGAWPYGLWGEYDTDTAEIQRYAQAARTAEGFRDYMAMTPAEPA